MRDGEWGNPDYIGKEQPTQPDDCGTMSDDEFIPRTSGQILESEAFAYRIGEKVRDELTNQQCAMLAYYLRSDTAEAARLMKEITDPWIASVVSGIHEDDRENGSYVRV